MTIKRKSKTATLREFTYKATEIYGTAKITRQQSIEANLKFYWTGDACPRGHVTYRYTNNCVCRQCNLDDLEKLNYGEKHEGLEVKNKTEDLKYQLELKRLEKEYDYDL